MEDQKRDYQDAYDSWQIQLRRLHGVLLKGERIDPPLMKGLLNREARAKERYEEARRRLLGLSE